MHMLENLIEEIASDEVLGTYLPAFWARCEPYPHWTVCATLEELGYGRFSIAESIGRHDRKLGHAISR